MIMKILSSNDSEDWLLIRMKEMMNRFHKRNSSSASYVDFKSGEKLDFKFSTLQALQVYLFRFSYTQLLSVPLCHFRWIVKRFFNWCCLIQILFSSLFVIESQATLTVHRNLHLVDVCFFYTQSFDSLLSIYVARKVFVEMPKRECILSKLLECLLF